MNIKFDIMFILDIFMFIAIYFMAKGLYCKRDFIREMKSLGKVKFNLRKLFSATNVTNAIQIVFAVFFIVKYPSVYVVLYCLSLAVIVAKDFLFNDIKQIREKGFVDNNEKIVLWKDISKIRIRTAYKDSNVIDLYLSSQKDTYFTDIYFSVPKNKTEEIVEFIKKSIGSEVPVEIPQYN